MPFDQAGEIGHQQLARASPELEIDSGRAAVFDLSQCLCGHLLWATVLKEFRLQSWEIQRQAANEPFWFPLLFSMHFIR